MNSNQWHTIKLMSNLAKITTNHGFNQEDSLIFTKHTQFKPLVDRYRGISSIGRIRNNIMGMRGDFNLITSIEQNKCQSYMQCEYEKY